MLANPKKNMNLLTLPDLAVDFGNKRLRHSTCVRRETEIAFDSGNILKIYDHLRILNGISSRAQIVNCSRSIYIYNALAIH